jgi:hypothetical protein
MKGLGSRFRPCCDGIALDPEKSSLTFPKMFFAIFCAAQEAHAIRSSSRPEIFAACPRAGRDGAPFTAE